MGLITALLRLSGPASVPTPGLRAVKTAIADAAMRRGVLLMVLPSVGFGMMNVLVPLRLDELGAGAKAIAALFLWPSRSRRPCRRWPAVSPIVTVR